MRMGKVIGSVWATRKAQCLQGQTFLVVESDGEQIVAADGKQVLHGCTGGCGCSGNSGYKGKVNCSLPAGPAANACMVQWKSLLPCAARYRSILLSFLPQKRYRAVPNGVTIIDQPAHELSAATRR